MAGPTNTGLTPHDRHESVRVRRARIEEIRDLAREYGQEAANLSWYKRASPDPIPEGGIFWIAEDAGGRAEGRAGGEEADEEALGYAAGSLRAEGLTVGPVYVRPAVRRRGVGQELLQAIQGWAEETGLPVVEVSVAAGNEAGRSFLESAGYVPRRILFSYASGREGGRASLIDDLEW
ncbi:MAG: GNAT family N-acetyltransferase [Actinomycetota bacterium]|nr:GNAT family N-acetyltransferase [Actinomycetota bacterium]